MSSAGQPALAPLAAGVANVTAKNLSRALTLAGSKGLFLGFSAMYCSYCAVHEAEYAVYTALAQSSATLPPLMRVNADKDRSLLRRHEVEEIPALVLARSHDWTAYTGPHESKAMAEFGEAQASPLVDILRNEAQLRSLLERQRAVARQEAPSRVLLVGFFNDLEEEEEELDDLRQAARQLRRQRTDVPVRAVALRASRSVTDDYGRRRKWFSRSPCAVLLVNGEPSGGEFRLDERDEGGLDLAGWAARAAVPELGELTGANFAAYAATELPMLIAFVRPSADNRGLLRELRAVARRFRSKVATVWCDGERHATRMLSLGLRTDTLPQVAFNTKDGRQLPYGEGRSLSEAALSQFAADFLGEKLQTLPRAPPAPLPASSYVDGAVVKPIEAVIELGPSNFDAVAMDVRRDVLLQLYAGRGCEACEQMVIYYNKCAAPHAPHHIFTARRCGPPVITRPPPTLQPRHRLHPTSSRVAERFAQLEQSSVVVARMDVGQHPLPAALKSVQLHALPILLALPARSKVRADTDLHPVAAGLHGC